MKKDVKVLAVVGDELIVGCDRTACEGCKGSLFCSAKNTEFKVDKPKGADIKEGDIITIYLPAKKTIFTSFMSLGLPLIMFMPGYYIGMHFLHNEGWALIFSLLAVLLGFALSGLFFRLSKKKWAPMVTSYGEKRNQ